MPLPFTMYRLMFTIYYCPIRHSSRIRSSVNDIHTKFPHLAQPFSDCGEVSVDSLALLWTFAKSLKLMWYTEVPCGTPLVVSAGEPFCDHTGWNQLDLLRTGDPNCHEIMVGRHYFKIVDNHRGEFDSVSNHLHAFTTCVAKFQTNPRHLDHPPEMQIYL